jgi:hypothetical protein
MPSSKDPTSVVKPGPGKVPAGSVTISSLTFAAGGSGDLAAHIADPVDAHMAFAIGIPETDPVSGLPLLSTIDGGAYDGESVLDALRMLKDLVPPRPDHLGFNNVNVPNSGVPSWGSLDLATGGGSAHIGGFTDAGSFVPSVCIVPNSVTTSSISGVVYPADRGVLAVYYSTDNSFSGGSTSLVSALWLGPNPAPSGIPTANFVESTRPSGQTDYTATGSGIDKISLTFRLPYLKDYTGSGASYSAYQIDFPAFQLATYATSVSVSSDKAGSYLLVHWREGFATTLAAISTWNTSNLTSLNCYSATPTGSVPSGETAFDVGNMKNVGRHNIFRDSLSGTSPSGSCVTSVPAGTTHFLSGVSYYATDLTFTLQVDASNLFNKSYFTGTVSNPPDVRPDFVSDIDPVQINLSGFGLSAPVGKHYTDLKDGGGTLFNSSSNVPLTTDTARLGPVASFAIPSLPPSTYGAPTGGWTQVAAILNKPGDVGVTVTDTKKYLYNGYPQSGGSTASTTTLEKFFDEKFRVDTTHTPLANDTLPPSGGAIYSSSTALVVDSGGPTTPKTSLQVVGGQLIYPQTDFSAAAFSPTGPNYNAVFLGDAVNSIRKYIRAFDTGIPRSTGRFRIKGLHLANFQASGALSGTFADHTGHVVILLQIPGQTGLLDLGRVKGDPDLSFTTDARGCLTGVDTTGPDDIFSYDMTLSTGDNGAGNFPIYMTIAYVKDSAISTPPGAGVVENIHVSEIEWLPPL